MPNALSHYCNTPGCSVLVPRGTRRCPAHERVYDTKRGTAQERGYDKRWMRTAKEWRSRHPLCGERADGQRYAEHSRCTEQGRDEPAQVTDRIRSIANGGDPHDEQNFQSLCLRCSARKRAVHDGNFGRWPVRG
jgi:5-methylcytosine-specific restriction enzyme A